MSRRQSLYSLRPRRFDLLRAGALGLSQSPSRVGERRNYTPRCEVLEARTMLSVAPLYYSATGAGNNQTNPDFGAAGQDLLRSIVASNYVDGISSMAGQIDPNTGRVNSSLPSARLISNKIGAQADDILDSRNLAAFIYAWGQFVDHDLDLTPDGGTSVPIQVPKGDPQFDLNSVGGQKLPFTRSATDGATPTASTPLNQVSVVTSFLDGSMIYGSDSARAAILRSGLGGQLRTSPGNLLPLNDGGLPNANNGPFSDTSMFLAGDIRANENIELTALQTLFMREHNRQARILAQQHPRWNDDPLYQGARQIVIAEIQSITFNQFLPALLGDGAITTYGGYDPTVNPGITPEFSEAAFRVGHSQLDGDVKFLNNDGSNFSFTFKLPGDVSVPINTPADIASGETGMPLVDAFFDPFVVQQPGVIGSIFKYLASDNAQAVDGQMVDAVRNILFGAPGSGAGGQDLFALDVQRGRDVGLPGYNAARVAYGLPAVTSFAQITSDPAVQYQLKKLYGTVDKVELFVGGIVEDHAPGSSMGATFQAIIANQFERVRDGDRLWYQNIFKGADLRAIQQTTLADIIRANTGITNLQSNVFFFDASITGSVFRDSNGNGRPDLGDPRLGNILVQLLDGDGNVIDSTRTAGDGSYSFHNLELDSYSVQISAPRAPQQVVPDPVTVQITRGGSVTVNFAFKDRSHGGPGDPGNILANLLDAFFDLLQALLNPGPRNPPFGMPPGNA